MSRKAASAPSAPPVPAELLDWLDRTYPERCPRPTQGEREIWMDVGRRDVVVRLRMERDRQLADSRKGQE